MARDNNSGIVTTSPVTGNTVTSTPDTTVTPGATAMNNANRTTANTPARGNNINIAGITVV